FCGCCSTIENLRASERAAAPLAATTSEPAKTAARNAERRSRWRRSAIRAARGQRNRRKFERESSSRRSPSSKKLRRRRVGAVARPLNVEDAREMRHQRIRTIRKQRQQSTNAALSFSLRSLCSLLVKCFYARWNQMRRRKIGRTK